MNNKLKKIFLSSLILFFSTFSTLYAFDKPIVSDIKAEYSTGTKINIQWNLPKNLENPITKLLVYRDTKPIKNFSDINNATFLKQLSGESFGYTDSVKDFRDYYYAVIAYTNEAYEFIMPSMNATVNGVRIPEKKTTTKKQKKQEEEKLYPSGTLRETPLPYLDLVEGFEKNENIISEKISNSVKDLGVYSDRKIEILEPYYFEEDLISPESGDAYFLFQILSEYFVQRKYEDAITNLTRLNRTKISSAVENRATFYLGQAYYFTGDYENAVRAFVKTEQTFPVQTKKWIESSLDMLEIEN